MSKEKPISRDEIKGLLLLILLFVSVVGGRWVGNYYASFQEMTELKVLFEVTEEELSSYVNSILLGSDPDLEVGIIIASSRMDNSANLVTTTPDYVNRWLIGLTVSPVLVNQPEASEVEVEMLIENTTVNQALFDFPREKISYIKYTDRLMKLDIEDKQAFNEAVTQATETYGGEVMITFRGRVHMHLLLLDTWLPFTVVRYPIVTAPYLGYVDSGWVSYENGEVSSVTSGEGGYVRVDFRNPTRIHSLSEEITCLMYMEGEEVPVVSYTKTVKVPPNTDGQYTFSFRFTESGVYTYRIVSGERVLVDMSPVLTVE